MSRKRWPMMAGVFAVGAAVGAAGATAVVRWTQLEGDDPADTGDRDYRDDEFPWDPTHGAAERNDAATRMPDLAVSVRAADEGSAAMPSSTGV
ncbi:hypothetical protein [Micromonospora sp. NPDC049679]|uniref:hypothetical protein n=1 Tax=Micromonospora sp. NPDC049679 TaxID=3155920 RepID=UPI0033DF4FEC